MTTLVPDERIEIALPEPSDVAVLPGDRFAIVGDKKPALAVVGKGGGVALVPLEKVGKKKTGLEAVTYDATSKWLHVFSEEHRALTRYRWDGNPDDAPVFEGSREVSFGGRKNKGVEGLAHLDPDVSPTGRGALLLANEGAPRGLFLLDDAGALEGEAAREIALDDAVLAACSDFSGIAFDPRSRRVLLVSDESSALVELALEGSGARLRARTVASHLLRSSTGAPLDRVEGVAVDATGRWWVLLEDERVLVRLRDA